MSESDSESNSKRRWFHRLPARCPRPSLVVLHYGLVVGVIHFTLLGLGVVVLLLLGLSGGNERPPAPGVMPPSDPVEILVMVRVLAFPLGCVIEQLVRALPATKANLVVIPALFFVNSMFCGIMLVWIGERAFRVLKWICSRGAAKPASPSDEPLPD